MEPHAQGSPLAMRGTCPNSVPRLAKPLNSLPSITTAPPMPVPTVRNTTFLAPCPAPYIVSPNPIRLASLPICTGRWVSASIRSARFRFSQPLIFSAPPNTMRLVSSTIPGVPMPMPSIVTPSCWAEAIVSLQAVTNWPITASADISAFDGNFP